MLQIGDRAPQATFVRPDGSAGSVAHFGGKKLVLYFYPKDDTSGCTREAQDFTSMASDFAKAGAIVLGISRDPPKSHIKFLNKYDLHVELGSDEDGSLCEAFGVWVEKSMYGRKYMGIERATFLISGDGHIRAIWRKVKVAGHAATVLEAAQALK